MYLKHYGVKGMRWGVRKDEKIFVSGSSKTQSKDSEYYRKSLHPEVKKKLDDIMKRNANILVGDCVGIDSQVQDYLAKYKYTKVDIFVSGSEVRNNSDKDGSLGWKIHNIDSSMYEPNSKEWHATKDKVMSKKATSGLAIITDTGSSATRKNIKRMLNANKNVDIFELGFDGKDKWIGRNK